MLVLYPEVDCPHCGERFSVPLDCSAGHEQQLVLDCEICCRPMVLHTRGGMVVRVVPEGTG